MGLICKTIEEMAISFGNMQGHIWEPGGSNFSQTGVPKIVMYVDPYWIEFLVRSFDFMGPTFWRLQVQRIVSTVCNTMKQHELRDDVLQRPKDLEWKLIYVGSAEDETYDQMLESVLVGPVNVGNYRFVFQADPPDPAKIREEDIIGVTVLLLTCSYMGQEFIRVGYYVNNDYTDEQLREEPPQKVLIDKVQRNILADKPRVTKFPINFQPETTENEEGQLLSLPDNPPERVTWNGEPSPTQSPELPSEGPEP
ncbi:hypothetical protein GIB67_022466 [Kingdonia uniflora]|uniref:Uncharacterized protein n=1 Tax=Kingdonia uniflora TaxID=39325 RepID=A0A7J7MU22_9MAGN|nr:hypothetical protein GIB67_022466 [Kingdonia uniflora]